SARPTLATRWRVGLDRPDHRRGADLDLQPADRRGDAALRARRHTRPDRRPDGGTERVVEQRPAARRWLVASVGSEPAASRHCARGPLDWRDGLGIRGSLRVAVATAGRRSRISGADPYRVRSEWLRRAVREP